MPTKEFYAVKQDGAYPKARIILKCPFNKCKARVIALSDAVRAAETTVQNPPPMLEVSKEASARTSQEQKERFFQVKDVWDFDNMGVSLPARVSKKPSIQNTELAIKRYLICSECNQGPLGFACLDIQTDLGELVYYLSCSSVLYDVEGA